MASEPLVSGDADDIVEGSQEASQEDGVTVAAAAREYFDWAAKLETQRRKRRSNGAASDRSPKAAPVFDEEARVSVTRFVSHCGPSAKLGELQPYDMAVFQETVGANAANLAERLRPVKEFLRYCWKERGYTGQNLGNHLKIKRAVGPKAESELDIEQSDRFEMTAAGKQQLEEELERHQNEMPLAIQAVAAAREDKDIRENAPLEAAREYQERLRSRIAELEYQIAHAVVQRELDTGMAHMSSLVEVERVDADGNGNGRTVTYQLVGATEVSRAERKISVESPMGQELVGKSAGDLVEFEAPRGTMRFRVLRVQG